MDPSSTWARTGFQSPQLLVPTQVRSQGHSPTPVAAFRPPCSYMPTQESPTPRKELEMELFKKIGQTYWPDTFLCVTGPFHVFFPLFFHIYSSPNHIPFPAFDTFPKHPIISLAQFQKAFPPHPIMSPVLQSPSSLCRELPPGTHGAGSHPTHGADALLGQPWRGRDTLWCLWLGHWGFPSASVLFRVGGRRWAFHHIT